MQEFFQQLINGLSVGAIYALIAVGYTMVYGILKLINFAHGEVFMLGAMTSVLLSTVFQKMGFSGPLALLALLAAAVLVCAIVGFTIERFAYRPLRGQTRITSLITAIGVSLLLQYGGQQIFGPTPRVFFNVWPALSTTVVTHPIEISSAKIVFAGLLLLAVLAIAYTLLFTRVGLAREMSENLSRLFKFVLILGCLVTATGGWHFVMNYPPIFIGALTISYIDLVVVGLTLLFMLTLTYIVLYTRLGLALRAVSHSFDTAALMGINIDRIVSFTFILGSAMAAAGGLLYAFKYRSITPLTGLMPGLKAFVAAVLGGIGSIPGAVLGGIVLGLVEVLVVGYVDGGSAYRDGVAFVILIAILLAKPSGLLGRTTIEKV